MIRTPNPSNDAFFDMHMRRRVGGYAETRLPGLRGLVETAWIYETPSVVDTATAHRVLPEPAVSLFCVGRRTSDGRLSQTRLIFQGPIRTPHWYRPEPNEVIAAARLAPEACAALLGFSPDEHPGVMEDVTDALGSWGRRLRDAVADAAGPEERLARLGDALRERAVISHRATDKVAAGAVGLIRRARGRARMDDVARRLDVSARHLRRRVRAILGIGPKTYARQLRLVHAITLADPRQRPNWAQVAAAAGYTDQAHMIGDAHRLAGVAPAALHRERRAQTQS